MTSITFLLMAFLAVVLAFTAYRRHASHSHGPVDAPSRPRTPLQVAPTPPKRPAPAPREPPARIAVEPKLELLEWDGTPELVRGPSPGSAADDAPKSGAAAALCLKIRDRYIAARFPCAVQSSAELVNVERVIKAARLMFEEDKADLAIELLELAAEQNPGEETLRLAQLEIAFLVRDARTYVGLALAFQRQHSTSEAWNEIARLGRAIAPNETAFGAAHGTSVNAHYGPWPDTPNWIQASWDLTGEVLGADFHRAMQRRARAARPHPLSIAA